MLIYKNNKLWSILIILFLIIFSLTACIREDDDGNANDINSETDERTTFEQKVDQINNNTLRWLGGLDVDPIELRYDVGIKGKKKFVELLDSYLILYQTEESEGIRNYYRSIVKELSNAINDTRYHDMAVINDTQFRQDSTSYLRAWYIITQFGLDTTHYKNEISEVLWRLDSHLPSRGINQKMVFVFYYHRLGFEIEYTLEELFNSSVIRERNKPNELDELELYFITHEIFVLYDDNNMSLLTEDDNEYLNSIIPYWLNKTIYENNVDLLAEIIMIMTYLGYENFNEYRIALEYLLNSQNSDGSFGDYEYARKYYEERGISVEIQLYLHTTEVSLRAINEAVDVFDPDYDFQAQ